MKTFRPILARNRHYFLFFFFFFLIGLVFLLLVGKATAFVDLNPYHRTGLDNFFIWVTFLGNGLFTVIVFVVFLLMRRWSQALQVITAFLLSGLLAQLLKTAFHMPRPKQFFAPGQYGHFIEGVTNLGFASFPSGHTTSIFTLATLLAFFAEDRRLKMVFLLGAVAVGYSRIYLGQHFLADVLTGSCIGIATAVFVHWLFTEKLRGLPLFAGAALAEPDEEG
jgi:membrane-associated phospholipid phosphatase